MAWNVETRFHRGKKRDGFYLRDHALCFTVPFGLPLISLYPLRLCGLASLHCRHWLLSVRSSSKKGHVLCRKKCQSH